MRILQSKRYQEALLFAANEWPLFCFNGLLNVRHFILINPLNVAIFIMNHENNNGDISLNSGFTEVDKSILSKVLHFKG